MPEIRNHEAPVLDEAQAAGAASRSALTVIEAGAGTGKTTTATERVVTLIGRGVEPSGVLASTFTRDAVGEMRERFAARLPEAAEQVRFTTLHALACGIIRRNPEAAGLAGRSFTISDKDEQAAAMREALEACSMVPPVVQGEEAERGRALADTAKEALRRIGRWKENGLVLAEATKPGVRRLSSEEEDGLRVWAAYETAMASRGLVEFADLTPLAVLAMEQDAGVRRREAGSVRHLLVDEWQDTNLVQLQMVRLLASEGADVTVVGDDDQSIYAWRGAVPHLMERTAAMLPEVASRGSTRCRLVTNRRCTDEILAPANLVVDYNPRQEPKVLASGRSGAPVTVSAHADEKAEAAHIAAMVASLVAKGAAPSSIAVLSRGRSVAAAVGRGLLQARVPHLVQAGVPFLERSEVKDILAYLKLAANPYQDFAFSRIAAKPTRGIGPKAAELVIGISSRTDVPIHEALVAASLTGEGRAGAALMSRHLASLAASEDASAAPSGTLEFVLGAIGYRDWAMARPDVPETFRDSLETLVEICSGHATLAGFLEDVSLSADTEARSRGVVHVGTLHGSKGREWDHVFLAGFEDGAIPNARAIEEAEEAGDGTDPWIVASAGGLGEERRLAHVGLTRARHTVHVSYAASRRGRQARPSRLFREAELRVPKPAQTRAAPVNQKDARGKGKRMAAALW